MQNSKTLTLPALIAINLLYTFAIAICALTTSQLNIPIIFWFPTAVLVNYAIIYGYKGIWAITLSTLLLLLNQLLNKSEHQGLSLTLLTLTGTDILTSLLFLFYYKGRRPKLNYSETLKKFIFLAAIAVSLQTGVLVLIRKALALQHIELQTLAQLSFSSIALSLFSLLPFLLAMQGKSAFRFNRITLKHITILLLFTIAPIAINSIRFNSLPLDFIIVVVIVIFVVRNKINISSLLVLTFSISTVVISTQNHNHFSFYPFPQNIINAQYFSIFLGLLVLVINAILNERDEAIQGIKESYRDIQDEVERQTRTYIKLNQQLKSEIAHRQKVEETLNLSKKLLTESQEIANITSWEYNKKHNTIRWSESAARILGIKPTTRSTFAINDYINRIHPDDKRIFLNAISQVSRYTESINIEIRYLVNKEYRNLLIRGKTFDDSTSAIRIVGVLSDISDWKQAQVALSEKELRYRALFDANIDPVVLIDGSTKTILDVNYEFERQYGYSKDEIIGTPYIRISSQEVDSRQAIEIALEKGFYRVSSRIHRKKSGEEFWIEGHFVRFMSDNTARLFAIFHDNTSRKNYEYRLAERELKFRLFFESNLIGMAETTIYKTWITYNTKLCNILGYSASELERITWDKITHPNDLTAELELFNRIVQHKTDNYTLQKRFIKKDGTIIFCNVAVKAMKDASGEITHMVKLIEDITPRKKAESALIESQTRLKKAQQIAHLGVCQINLNNNTLYISDEAYSILGWEKANGNYTPKHLINATHPDDKSIIQSAIERIRTNQQHEEDLHARFIRPTGEVLHLTLNIGIEHSNNCDELLITFADITTAKLAEISLREANAMKDQLFSVISHDLRGPISSVEQMLDFLVNQRVNMDEAEKYEVLGMLHTTTKESLNLLENLLEWGRGQRQLKPNAELTDIQSTIDDTNALLASLASNKNITINTSIEPNCKAFVDPVMLKTILRNLINNAIKFTPQNGRIAVEAHTDNQLCIVSITDTGIGVAPEKVDLLFDDSKIFSTYGTNNEKGTGLGLKLVKRFIDKNSGTIKVTSKVGSGTTFTIALPTNKPA